MKHTALPWYILGEDRHFGNIPFIEIASGEMGFNFKSITNVNCSLVEDDFKITERDKENAKFILKACNNYYKMINIIERLHLNLGDKEHELNLFAEADEFLEELESV